MNEDKPSTSNQGDIYIQAPITGGITAIGHGGSLHASNVDQTMSLPLDHAALKDSLLELFKTLGNVGLSVQEQMEVQTLTGLAAQQTEAATPQVEMIAQYLQQIGQSLQYAQVSIEEGSQLTRAVTKLAHILGPVVGGVKIVAGWFGVHLP